MAKKHYKLNFKKKRKIDGFRISIGLGSKDNNLHPSLESHCGDLESILQSEKHQKS